ncbi:VAMP714 protein [Hibiscus syriacus]|uniref:VAMP714 protein n=1 Tax=Hibiscus syriacus TaxID=106335 RepID=A0A6A2ZN77_HIBSY|nr:VAMP714 protein [Hibiscus syriacus]
MAILYAVVARGTVVLAEFSAVTGTPGRWHEGFSKNFRTRPIQDYASLKIVISFIYLDPVASVSSVWLTIPLELYLLMDLLRFLFCKMLRNRRLSYPNHYSSPCLNAGRIPFSYLEDIQMRFMKNYGKVAHYALAYAMNDEFSRELHQKMEFSLIILVQILSIMLEVKSLWLPLCVDECFRELQNHLLSIQANTGRVLKFSITIVSQLLMRKYHGLASLRKHFMLVIVCMGIIIIRTIMVENIDKILSRGDRIELLVDKTATMKDGAFHFKKQSKRLHQALRMKNAKLSILLTCLIVLLLHIIIAACCGGITLPSCRS